jgi:Ca-activated chloride channel family protein
MKSSKAIFFAIAAMLAAMLAVTIMEALVTLLPKKKETRVQADVVFVVDTTGSMSASINGIRRGIEEFAREFAMKEIDLNVGLVSFKDCFEDRSCLKKLNFNGSDFTTSATDFSQKLSILKADGGGDGPESAIDGLNYALDMNWKSDQRILVFVSDAPFKNPDASGMNSEQLKKKLASKLQQLHFISNPADREYLDLKQAIPGKMFSLNEMSNNEEKFKEFMPLLAGKISTALNTLQGSGYDDQYEMIIKFVFVLWTGVLSYAIAFILIFLQNRYLKKEYPLLYVAKKVWINFVVGCLAYLLGDFLFAQDLFGFQLLNRLIGWLLMGAVIGASVSKTVPNYSLIKAIQGGLIGGALGGLVFQMIAYTESDFMSRLIGAMALGFFIGLMIAIFENISKAMQLVINWGPKDTSYVSLGTNKVLLASHLDADVFLPKSKNPEGHSYSIYLENNQVYCENLDTYEIFEISSQKTFNLNGMEILVKSN